MPKTKKTTVDQPSNEEVVAVTEPTKYELDISKINSIEDVKVILALMKLIMNPQVYNTSSDLVKNYFTPVNNDI